MKKLLSEVEAQMARFCDLREMENSNGAAERRQHAWKTRQQYLQGRIESLQEIKKLILSRLEGGSAPDRNGAEA